LNSFSLIEINEILDSLKELTISIISGYRKQLPFYLQSLNRLAKETENILYKSKHRKDVFCYINYFLELLDCIKNYGSPYFVIVAREAFIAQSICNSLVAIGAFSESEINMFKESLVTIASKFDTDLQKYFSKKISRNQIFHKYGHLRAGTYDITAQRYDQMRHSFLDGHIIKPTSRHFSKKFYLNKNKLRRTMRESIFLNISAKELLFFIKSSIEQREIFKFEFSRSLSLALELLAKAGELLGFSREEIAYLDIPTIRASKFYTQKLELREFWKSIIEERKRVYSYQSLLILPSVIKSKEDFEIIHSLISRPNFVTQKCVSCELVNLEENTHADIKGKIVLLQKADPGFDWIFASNIKGLITKYGGAASHMAIRCAEFGIPAAIGCGEKIYNKILLWKKLKLDCKRKIIQSF
jgi:phosphohistidine swiveling domain-containing protein